MYKILIYERFEDIQTEYAGCVMKMFDDYEEGMTAVRVLTSMGFVIIFGKE